MQENKIFEIYSIIVQKYKGIPLRYIISEEPIEVKNNIYSAWEIALILMELKKRGLISIIADSYLIRWPEVHIVPNSPKEIVDDRIRSNKR